MTFVQQPSFSFSSTSVSNKHLTCYFYGREAKAAGKILQQKMGEITTFRVASLSYNTHGLFLPVHEDFKARVDGKLSGTKDRREKGTGFAGMRAEIWQRTFC